MQQNLQQIITTEDWIDSITDENGVYIGQDKEVIGYYKRIGIAKIGGTYEDMLEFRDIEKQGYLVANDDCTAFFELDGEKTEYVFDGANFYLSDDKERANGFRFSFIDSSPRPASYYCAVFPHYHRQRLLPLLRLLQAGTTSMPSYIHPSASTSAHVLLQQLLPVPFARHQRCCYSLR